MTAADAIGGIARFIAALLARKSTGDKLAPVAPVVFPAAPVVFPSTPSAMKTADLARCTGASLANAAKFLPYLMSAMDEFGIITTVQQAAFLSQVGHESGGLRYTVEIWGPTPAQARYEGRGDLGNTHPGDGSRFRGRGLLQTTGRYNYQKTGAALGVDLITSPELLGQPALAARSAGWYWQTHGLNAIADDCAACTRKINGGMNGYAERLALFEAAKGVLL